MIYMMGQGWLYHIHHNRQEMLTRMEKRRAKRLATSIVACLVVATLLWLRH